MNTRSLRIHFTIWCLFRKLVELKDGVLSHRCIATSHYELPANSETESRCSQCSVDFAATVHCRSLRERGVSLHVAHSFIVRKIAKNKYPKAMESLTCIMETCRYESEHAEEVAAWWLFHPRVCFLVRRLGIISEFKCKRGRI